MIRAFEYDDYRGLILERLNDMPNHGYGQMSKLSRFIGVHSTLISQIIKGHKQLTTDQAVLVAEFFGLGELETEYFVLLVQLERAGNPSAKNLCRKLIRRIRAQAQSVSYRVTAEAKLTEEQRAIFYSDWAYSAVRQSLAIPAINTIDAVADHLGLPRKKVQVLLEFLVQTGLCKVDHGRLLVGPASTHVEASSPWARVHHSNWRQRAISSFDSARPNDLHYTSPLTISAVDSNRAREKILQLIEQLNLIIDPSPSEQLFCLNLDWFQVGK